MYILYIMSRRTVEADFVAIVCREKSFELEKTGSLLNIFRDGIPKFYSPGKIRASKVVLSVRVRKTVVHGIKVACRID